MMKRIHLAAACLFVVSSAVADDRITLGPCPHWRGLSYLYQQSPRSAFFLLDQRDGNGPTLIRWDESQLGQMPLKADVEAADARIAAVEAMRVTLRADYATLPAGVQATFRSVYDEAQAKLIAGDVAAARDIIATTPVGPTLAAARDALLAIIDAAFPQP